jgi:methyltransferase (TIGR00027 family)
MDPTGTPASGPIASNASSEIRDRIAVATAVGQACHQIADNPCIYSDDLTIQLLGLSKETLAGLVGDDPGYRHARFYVAARNRFATEAVSAAVAAGARQIVILDAGLLTVGYRNRQPEVRIFEVDRAEAQSAKRRRLADADFEAPSTLQFVQSDVDTAVERLEAAGFESAAPSLFLWFDMVALHREYSVRSVLRYLAERPAAQLIVDYVESDDALPQTVSAMGINELTGFRPDELADYLQTAGFDSVEDTEGHELVAQYTGTPLADAIPVALHVIRASHRQIPWKAMAVGDGRAPRGGRV